MHVIPVPAPSSPSPFSSLSSLLVHFPVFPPPFLITVHPALSAECVNPSILAAFYTCSQYVELLLNDAPSPCHCHLDQTEAAVPGGRGGNKKGCSWKQRASEKEMALIMSTSRPCLPLLYPTQSDAGMSGVLLLFDHPSPSLSIRRRRGKNYNYLNHPSSKTSLGPQGGETLISD